MDTQQNQPGSPMAGNDIRVKNEGASNAPAGTGASNSQEGGAASSIRKSNAAARSSQGAQGSTGSADQATASAGGSDQNKQGGEGQQEGGNVLDTALQSSKKWIEDSGVLNNVNALPQNVKDWSNRAVSRVNELTTTQKIVGGALLAVGIGYLATRKGKSSTSEFGNKSGSGYGRRSYGYQAPDATNSRRVISGSGRTDSGSAYGNSGSASRSYGGSSGASNSHSADKGNSFGSSSSTSGDYGSRTSESSYRGGSADKSDDFRSVE